MATYQSDVIASGCPAKSGVYDFKAVFQVTFQSVPASGDLIQLCLIPPNVWLADFLLDIPELDTDGSPTIGYVLKDDLSPKTTYTTSRAQPASGELVVTAKDTVIGRIPHSYVPASTSEGQALGTLELEVLPGAATPQTAFPQTLKGWAGFSPL